MRSMVEGYVRRGLRVIDRNKTIVRARELRRSLSLPEGLLWQVLRQRPEGFKFRRQHPVGPYIADFYCPAAKLVIEIDGQSHDAGNRPIHDERRDEWLREQGLSVAHFSASDVMTAIDSVITGIVVACRG